MLVMAAAARDNPGPVPFPFSPLSRRRSHHVYPPPPELLGGADWPGSSATAVATCVVQPRPRAQSYIGQYAPPGSCAYCNALSPKAAGQTAPRHGGGLFEANFQPCPVCCELFKMTLLSPDAAELKGSCRAAWAGLQESPNFEQRLKRLELDMALVPEGQESSDAAGKRLKAEWNAEEERMFQDFLAHQDPDHGELLAAVPIPVPESLPEAAEAPPPALQSPASASGRACDPACDPTCDLCHGPLSFQMVQSVTGTVLDGIYLENCCHVLCRVCTKRTIIAEAQAPTRACSSMRCPLCPNTVVSPADLQAILPAADYDRLLTNELHCLVAGDTNFTKCPACNVIIERDHRPLCGSTPQSTTAQEEPQQYALEGVPCSKEAFFHHSEQRFRCRECNTQFCAECSAVPYHTGKTCKEFKAFQVTQHCRYCEEPVTEPTLTTRTGNESRRPSLLSFLTQSYDRPEPPAVCNASECQERAAAACPKLLRCGHFCCGVRDEQTCLPCLQQGCSRRHPRQSGEEFCAICYTEVLSAAPCIQLGCKHVFHLHCLNRRINQRWPGPRISFGFMNCPSCGVEMKHPMLSKQMKAANQFKDEVVRLAKQRMVFEGLDKCAAVTEKGSPFHRQPLKYAMDQLCFYQCFACRKPYFGGFRSCEDMAEDAEEEDGGYEPGDLICGACVPNQNRICCNVHGTEFIEYKCKFCCNIAQWYCWGTTHFCTSCHRLQERGEYVTKKPKDELPRCPGRKKCPCRVDHPPNGQEYALGCAICRHSTAAPY